MPYSLSVTNHSLLGLWTSSIKMFMHCSHAVFILSSATAFSFTFNTMCYHTIETSNFYSDPDLLMSLFILLYCRVNKKADCDWCFLKFELLWQHCLDQEYWFQSGPNIFVDCLFGICGYSCYNIQQNGFFGKKYPDCICTVYRLHCVCASHVYRKYFWTSEGIFAWMSMPLFIY